MIANEHADPPSNARVDADAPALAYANRILGAVTDIAHHAMLSADWREGADHILQSLGLAARVSRCYLFEARERADGIMTATQLFEWCAPGVTPEINNPDLQDAPFAETGFSRWEAAFRAGEPIYWRVDEVHESERELMTSQGIASMLGLPVMVGGRWWGFVGLDQNEELRIWSKTEVSMLGAAAGIIGSAIERSLIQSGSRRALAALDALADPVFILDVRSGRLVYANAATAAWLNQPVAALLALDPDALRDLALEHHLDRIDMSGAEAGSDRLRTRVLVSDPDEPEVWLDVYVQRIDADTRGEYVVVLRDVSAVVAAGKRSRRAQRLESIGTLAGGLAHDLNNVLAPILMSVDMLRDHIRPQSSVEASEVLDAIERSAGRAADMVRHLLGFAKGTDGESALVDLNEMAAEVHRIAEMTFPKNIDLRLQPCPKLSTVRADPTQMHQVLLNLLVNARDAMPQGGRLDVQVDRRSVGPDFAGTITGSIWGQSASGSYALLRVRDQGHGIAPDVLERIFDPFFSTKRQDLGTGLGLSTALGIVTNYGGFMRVESWPGMGTVFEVYLPLQDLAPLSAPVAERPQLLNAAGEGQTVLYVDDEEGLRIVAELILKRNGFKPLVCGDGADALVHVLEGAQPPAVIVTDLAMPGMSGISLIRAVRRLKPELPIVVASGRFDDQIMRDLDGLGIVVMLRKPFTEAEFVQAVEAAVLP